MGSTLTLQIKFGAFILLNAVFIFLFECKRFVPAVKTSRGLILKTSKISFIYSRNNREPRN